MKWYQKILTVVSAVVLVTVLGCSAWMDGLTPTYVDPTAIEISGVEPTIFTPYTSLWDAKRIRRALNYQFFLRKISAIREIEDIDTRQKHLDDTMQMYIESAEELRDTLFSPTGPLSILFAAVPALGLGAYLIPRPADRRRIAELENGKTS